MWLSCQFHVVLVSVNTLKYEKKCERETFLNASYTEVMVYLAFIVYFLILTNGKVCTIVLYFNLLKSKRSVI